MVSSSESTVTTEDTTFQVVNGNAPSTASEEWSEDLTTLASEFTETESMHDENPMILDSSDMTSFSPDAERLMAGADEERNERLFAGGAASTTTVQTIRTLPDGRVEQMEDVQVVDGKRRSTTRTIRVVTSKSRGSRRSRSRSSKRSRSNNRSRSVSRSIRIKKSKSAIRKTPPKIALIPFDVSIGPKNMLDKDEVKKIYTIPISLKRLRKVVDYYDEEKGKTIVHLMVAADDVVAKYVVEKK